MKKFNLNVLLLIIPVTTFLVLCFFAEKSLQSAESVFCRNGGNTVVIDAGHGGEDGGAVGLYGILEKDINLCISHKLRYVLLLLGADTLMTRCEDVSLSADDTVRLRERKVSDIRARVDLVNNIPEATLISIHQNSFSEDSCSGAQVFYSDGNINSKILADSIQLMLKIGVDKDNKRIAKISDKNIFILQKAKCPAVLVECGFLTNPREADLLRNDIYQTKMAVCIAAGYVKNKSEK